MSNTERFKELWLKRNPTHDINVNTGNDMFWATAEMVAREYSDWQIDNLQAKVERLQSIASENQKISDGWRESYLKAMDKLEAEEAKTRELHKARILMQKCLDRHGVLDLHELREVKEWLGDKE